MQTRGVSHADYVHYLFFWRLYSKTSRLRDQESPLKLRCNIYTVYKPFTAPFPKAGARQSVEKNETDK